MKFTKPATSFDDQIKILESRGMTIPDHGRARHYLSHLNYYRIGAYWLPFETNHSTHTFAKGTNFEDVLSLYVFDRELRLLVMDAIERIEVSVRTQWAYHLAHTYGSHAHLNSSIFNCQNEYLNTLAKLAGEIGRSRETFIKHLLTTYDEAMPAIWAVVEIISFGQLSKFYANLKMRHDRNKIAQIYNLDETILISVLHHLNTVRNTSAHHSRLWNRSFTVTMKRPKKDPQILRQSFNPSKDRKIYNTLVMLEYLMEKISPGTHWKQRLFKLFQDHPVVDPKAMGFPDNWKNLPIWQ
ncbi:MAG: Abi family protein [Gammaproteobacteria bacterium]|nr:Abi family protein [Gammaproteobacteria bacterium]